MIDRRWGAAGTALLALAACSKAPELTVRAQSSALAQGEKPASFRVAEARSYFAMGSIALAAEGFRRALREDPGSVDALNGLAACYDRMGRFDVSRSYYERALALAPDDARLYANLATSLSLQGKPDEAAKVRSELAARTGAATTATVALAPAVAVAEAPVTNAAPAVAVPLVPLSVAVSGPRIERIGLGEVMLVTRESTTPRLAAKAAPGAPAQETLLNAARVSRLAASTRMRLTRMGWTQVTIGDAPRVLAVSEIRYPEHRRGEAQRLARQLGIPLGGGNASGRQVVVHLGRDAARHRASS